MPPERIIDEDEEYESSQDSDFAPDDAPEAASGSSDSEDEADEASGKRRRPANNVKADREEDYKNSGDEAIIQKGQKQQKKAKAKGEAVDNEGGEGGLIKTRRQRAAEKEERQYAANIGPVTVDIDAVWAEMMAGGTLAPGQKNEEVKAADGNETAVQNDDSDLKEDVSNMIRIKRTYNFAGRVHTEEKLVARDSAEAKLYLASQGEDALPDALPTKRLTKKAFRSAFEPVAEGITNRSDLNLGLAARMKAANEAQAKKLNTVEKSRMDWAGFVDKEGIKDELALAGKSKDSYASRQDFLARSEALRDVEARKARVGGRL
ncbi:bucentaur or craniofacial development domain-containing protein [Trichoderma barbatum]